MYLKILKENMLHHGFQYKEGLNVDVKPFYPTPECGGGLFFADAKDILKFSDYGTKIAIVTVPKEDLIVKVANLGIVKYKSHSIILSDIRELWTVETFQWLVELGADIHARDDLAFRCAAKNGHLEVVEHLVGLGANIHVMDDYALQWAANDGYLEIVKYLIKTGANIHARNDFAFRCAANDGYLEVVKYLTEQGANIHVEDDYAFRCAAKNGHLEIVEYLESKK